MIGTFDKYNEVESKKKGKRPAIEKDSDSEDAVCAKKKRKGNKLKDNMIVAYQPEVKAKTNDRKAINARMINCDALKCMKKIFGEECTSFCASDKFSGPLLLHALIYVNSTVSKKEMKEILKDNLLKGRNLMEDNDNKLDIALAVNSDDEEDLEKDDDDEETDGDDDAPDGDNDCDNLKLVQG
ncbi:hypothetical protein Tco_1028822 [Tanacetum coccineum]|uniref:Uncharacterized protein n=1 Tax=Tanacetum coccineum TaxID=301880 RepID=A0ABQ5G204_9ASTR